MIENACRSGRTGPALVNRRGRLLSQAVGVKIQVRRKFQAISKKSHWDVRERVRVRAIPSLPRFYRHILRHHVEKQFPRGIGISLCAVELLDQPDAVRQVRQPVGTAEQARTAGEVKGVVYTDVGRPLLAGDVGLRLQERKIELRIVNHQGIVVDEFHDLRKQFLERRCWDLATISSVIPWMSVTRGGIGRCGCTREANLSVISPSTNLKKATSTNRWPSTG